MCGNRVEELESRVKELEASVEGLTDELVECKVRLRELEDAVDQDLGFVPEPTGDESASVETEQAESSSGADDPTAAEATKSEAPDTGDKTEEPDSDIIIA
jgi:chromosome segregation ATPase